VAISEDLRLPYRVVRGDVRRKGVITRSPYQKMANSTFSSDRISQKTSCNCTSLVIRSALTGSFLRNSIRLKSRIITRHQKGAENATLLRESGFTS